MEERPASTASSAAAAAAADEEPKAPLFPLFPASDASRSQRSTATVSTVPQWLCNSSFTADLSIINHAVSNLPETHSEEEEEEEYDKLQEKQPESKPSPSYEYLESSPESDRDRRKASENKEKKKKKKRKRKRSKERGGGLDDYRARKSDVRAWAGSETNPSKDYYFDSRGDPDNLAFGGLYRMDIARYKPSKLSGLDFQISYRWKQKVSMLDRDGDVDSLDSKLVSAGRYWSAKYTALERHKNLKRIRLLAPQKSTADEFIPLSDIQTHDEGLDGSSVSGTSIIEESWEDEVLRKTREFNKQTREHPHNEKVWLAFAEFQDRVAAMQPQKGARLQTLEKKISILEKAAELNPDNEDLLLCLLEAYQSRDSTDVLIGRWEKILIEHPGSYKLWREFLHVVQGEFSRFKVSDIRKMYAHAIQALSTARSKHFRQVHQSAEKLSPDAATVQLELGLVDIFLSLCRFEWQAGYLELSTALFQAEIEFSLFSPSLLLTEQSKRRLFEHFWNSDGARVGEDGALGWSTWLEKEEENRQKIVKEVSSDDEKGGWTGWLEPLSKDKDSSVNLGDAANNGLADEELQEEFENEDIEQEDETEALLKKLGIDVEAEASCEVKDTSTWTRWSEEESSRDCDQWMPVRGKSGYHSDGTPDREADEQLLRVILYEDVSEYLFSLSSGEARLSLVYQFIDFFGGKISQWDLKEWNTQEFGNVESQKTVLMEELKGLEGVEEERFLSETERARKSLVIADIERMSLLEEISWQQNSRALWLKEGDRCTKFFHQVANKHRRNNAIDTLLIDGAVSSNHNEISDHIVNYYDKLFSEQFEWRPRLDGLVFYVLDSQVVERLERPFEEGEVSICTNSSSWTDKILGLEALPNSMLEPLRWVQDALTKTESGLNGFSLEVLLGSSNEIPRTDKMKFLRNATLLCLSVFPRNYILEEAALVAEELSVTKMNSCSSSDTPCRTLAKGLLKSDRQDVLLCGVYARREAVYGNIDHARRVFDMALSLIEGLPVELRSSAPLLYLWYAEAELANSGDSSFRALHILSCLGSGATYSPFKGQPSSLQLLKARQGFKDKIRMVRSAWARGLVDDPSIALICSAASFEGLTSGWAVGIEVLDQAFAIVLPERRSHSYQLEYLFNYYVRMLQRHHEQSSLSKVWESISRGLQIYPFSPELFGALVEIGLIYTTSNKLRLMFDNFCHKKPSVIVWIFALLFEMSRGSSQHRIHGLFERALANDNLRNSVVLWRSYIAYEIDIACNPSAARRIFFRAIHACPWSKRLWLDGFLKLNSILTAKELSDLQEVMRDKELNLRTDIYEILLQDEPVQ